MPRWLFASLRGYRLDWLPGDLVAGLMVAAITIPGQIATARLAGMPPATGIYAFVAGSVAFAAFGANRFMSVGADSTIAPIFAGGLAALAAGGAAGYAEQATLLAVLVGAVLLAIGLARAGWLATLLSAPVVTGFLAGIAIHIIVGELPTLLGIPGKGGDLLLRLWNILGRVGEANPYDAALGAGVLVVTLATARLSSRIPGPLIALIAAGAAVAGFHLGERGVGLLGPLDVPLPRITLPLPADLHELAHLLPLTLVVAMVCMMQTAAVAGTFPSEDDAPDNVSRDFAGVGAGSILAGLVGAFAVDASPPSTAIIHESGGRSQVAALTACVLMVALVVLAAGLTAYVPYAALSGILVYIALRIFRLHEMIRIYRRGGLEILLVAASAALVVVLPIETGMLLAIMLSFVHSLYIVARPYCIELARLAGTTVWWPPAANEHGEHEDGVLVFAPAAPINFTNVEFLRRKIEAAIADRRPPVRLLVIEASGIIDIDYTGSQTLQRFIKELQARNIVVAMARLSDRRAQAQAHRTGLIETVGADHVFISVEEAVQHLHRTPAA